MKNKWIAEPEPLPSVRRNWRVIDEDGNYIFHGSESQARLIASAPCLLAALVRAERHLDYRYSQRIAGKIHSDTLSVYDASLGDDLSAIRAAIAKASTP